MISPPATGLLGPLFSTDRARGIFSDAARLQGMLDFEAALARAEASAGVIPAQAAPPIAASCRAELFDAGALARGAAAAGNLAIPLVKALTERVRATDAGAARWVHWGATSQDAQDTGLVLQLRQALDALEEGLGHLSDALAELAARHRRTLLAGRTWLQQAQPITFGLKAAGWLGAVERHRARLAETRRRALVLQLGGAVGTLDALGPRALEVAAAVARELRLELPDLPWHAHRDGVAEVATTLGLLVGTLGKIATDVALLMQTEVGEAFEPDAPGRGGSSAMPQKRNPVGAAVARAAAVRVPALVSAMLAAMVQEHERGLGGWHAEWETLPEIAALAAGALEHVTQVVGGLEVDAARMRRNLDATGGALQAGPIATALARHLGREAAHERVAAAVRRARTEGRGLREVLAEDPEVQAALPADELDRLLDPERAVGAADALVDRALAARGRRRQG
jgi:3-carboxy-cis,cis-muconate cycloisomerase